MVEPTIMSNENEDLVDSPARPNSLPVSPMRSLHVQFADFVDINGVRLETNNEKDNKSDENSLIGIQVDSAKFRHLNTTLKQANEYSSNLGLSQSFFESKDSVNLDADFFLYDGSEEKQYQKMGFRELCQKASYLMG